MKKSHIIGIAVIAIAIFVIISTAGDASTYVTFEEAKTLFESGNDKKVHVVGQLKKDAQGEIVGVEPSDDEDPDGPPENLETDAKTFGLDPVGIINSRRGHM